MKREIIRVEPCPPTWKTGSRRHRPSLDAAIRSTGPGFRHSTLPYIMAPGMLGEASLTLWLLVMGVNVQRWKEQASAAIQWRPLAPMHS